MREERSLVHQSGVHNGSRNHSSIVPERHEVGVSSTSLRRVSRADALAGGGSVVLGSLADGGVDGVGAVASGGWKKRLISRRKERERKEKEREGENSLLGVWEGEKEERREERRVES